MRDEFDDAELVCRVLPNSTMEGVCHDGSPCPCLPCYAMRLRKRLRVAETKGKAIRSQRATGARP